MHIEHYCDIWLWLYWFWYGRAHLMFYIYVINCEYIQKSLIKFNMLLKLASKEQYNLYEQDIYHNILLYCQFFLINQSCIINCSTTVTFIVQNRNILSSTEFSNRAYSAGYLWFTLLQCYRITDGRHGSVAASHKLRPLTIRICLHL